MSIETQDSSGDKDPTGESGQANVYTAMQVARICLVNLKTVLRWYNDGRLKGNRVPGTQELSFTQQRLSSFLAEHGMPSLEAIAKVEKMNSRQKNLS